MAIRSVWMVGICALAICVAAEAAPRARTAKGSCASADEVTAMQATSIQQELMDAALTCGDLARDNYNAFQTRFGAELRTSDKLMLRMFGRVMGGSKGDKAYNLFKTELAARSELRRTQNHDEFCQDANLVAGAALGPSRLRLADLVSDIPVVDTAGGVTGCSLELASTLRGAKGIGVVPKPNPMRLTPAAAPASPTPASAAPATPRPQ